MSTVQAARPSVDKRYADICFGLFVAGAIAGALQLIRPVPFGDGFEMVAIAKNLAAHGTFSNPFWVLKTGPTAANPPLYPLLLAVLIKVFRLPALILAMACVGNIIMNALTASLLPRISRLFYGTWIPGAIAAIFWIVSAQLMPAWDVSYTVAGLLVFCLIFAGDERPKGLWAGTWFVPGVLAGLLFLLNPSSVLITVSWILWLAFRRRVSLRQGVAVFVVLCVFVVAWMARNRYQLGAYVARTNLGFTLYASNNDCAQATMFADESQNCYQSNHPNTSLAEAKLLRSMGEIKYDRLRTKATERWIESHPGRFGELTAERFRDFWFPPMEKLPYTACMIWIATALSIPGLILMIRRRHPLSIYVLAVLFIYPLMYYTVVSDVRYRYPVLWLTLLPAGYCILQLWPARFKRLAKDQSETLEV